MDSLHVDLPDPFAFAPSVSPETGARTMFPQQCSCDNTKTNAVTWENVRHSECGRPLDWEKKGLSVQVTNLWTASRTHNHVCLH